MRFAKLTSAVALLALAFAGASAPSPARAADAMTPDLRCLVVGLVLAGSSADNPQRQQAGLMLSVYFLGKVDAEGLGPNLESRVTAEASSMDEAALNAERPRCGDELSARGRALTEMGQHMQAVEPAPATPPAAH